MKSLSDFKQNPSIITEEEKPDYSKFDILVRAGLANKGQLQRIHRILDKMTEERPQFNNADREIMRNLFNRVIDLVSNNKQIFQQARRVVKEGALDQETSQMATSDFKISPTTGRKVRAHRFKVGERYGSKQDNANIDFQQEEAINEAIPANSQVFKLDPPPVLVLKRKAIRFFNNDTKIALYYNDRINKYFSIPYTTTGDVGSIVQAEEVQLPIIEKLQMIKESDSSGIITHLDGSKSTIDVETASNILEVYNELNTENKSKINTLIESSTINYNKVLNFIYNN